MILTPHNDPFFYQTLETTKVPDYSGGALIVDPETGMFREVDWKGLREYLWGGEYDIRLEQLGECEEDDE